MPTVARAAKKPKAKVVKKPSLVSKHETQPTYSVRVRGFGGAKVGAEIKVPVIQHNGEYADQHLLTHLKLKVGSVLRINLNAGGDHDSTGRSDGYEEDGAFIPCGFIDDRVTYPFILKAGSQRKPVKHYNLHYGPMEYFDYRLYFEIVDDSMLVK